METPYTQDTEPPAEQQSEPFATYNKYHHPEFAGYDGERQLKSILHKILPMALYRTWEVLVERQAPGNDCFLSIASISETTQRVERTIRLNIHELEARKLLELRAEQKLLRQKDGEYKLKLVVVKDFSGLYQLAREYLLWTQSDAYIEPARDFAGTIQSDESLKRKLRRFNNYRRVLLNKLPGPKPVERDEHRWYSEYDPSQDSQALGTSGGTSVPQQIEEAEGENTLVDRNHYLQKHLQKHLKKDSEERNIPSDQVDLLYEDSFDSGEASERGGGQDYTKTPNTSQTENGVRRDPPSPITKITKTNPYPVASKELGGAKQASGIYQAGKKEQADLDGRAQAFVQRAQAAYEATQGSLRGQGIAAAPKAKPNGLVSAFVREVSPLFYDQNVKASLTRALRVVEQTPLSQKDILACLIKAYLVTNETKTVKPQHRHPDGDNKMPLFVTMFARFAGDSASGKFGYTNEHLARDITADDRLVLFVVEHKLEDLLLEGTDVIDAEQEEAGQEEPGLEDATLSPENVQDLPADEEETRAEVEQLEQPEEPQQPGITVSNPEDGWSSWDGANYWGGYLREHYPYGVNEYRFDVQPTYYEGQSTGRWVFTFYSRRDPQHCWAIYGTKEEVDFHLGSPEPVWVAYDGVVGSTGAEN
jgi:hypothetical protein